jgi:hypothetical protein
MKTIYSEMLRYGGKLSLIDDDYYIYLTQDEFDAGYCNDDFILTEASDIDRFYLIYGLFTKGSK